MVSVTEQSVLKGYVCNSETTEGDRSGTEGGNVFVNTPEPPQPHLTSPNARLERAGINTNGLLMSL